MSWFSYLHDYGHGYVLLPRLDLAWAGAWFLVGEVLASHMWSACWLQRADKQPWWFSDEQRDILHTAESYQDYIMRIPQCAWLFQPEMYARDDLGAILPAKDDSWHTRVLYKLRYMSAFQIWHLKGSWTMCSTTHSWSATAVNPHQLHIRAAGGWRTHDSDDMHWQI